MECVARGAALFATGGRLGDGAPMVRIRQRALPTHDYGVALQLNGQWYGRASVVKGAGLPQSPDSVILDIPGLPGAGVPICAFRIEHPPEGQRFVRMGDYRFFPAFDTGGRAQVSIRLQIDDASVARLNIADLRTDRKLRLERLSSAGQLEMPRPHGTGDGLRKPQELSTIDSGKLAAARIRAVRHLQFTKEKAGDLVPQEIQDHCDKLEHALRALPEKDSPPELYQDVQNGCEQLRALIDQQYQLTIVERQSLAEGA
jgi:hypothetical protein